MRVGVKSAHVHGGPAGGGCRPEVRALCAKGLSAALAGGNEVLGLRPLGIFIDIHDLHGNGSHFHVCFHGFSSFFFFFVDFQRFSWLLHVCFMDFHLCEFDAFACRFPL